MNNRVVITACGCMNLQRSDLVYTKVNGENAWRCKNHKHMKKGAQQFAIVRCLDCDKPFVTTLRVSTNKKRCDPCQKEYAKELVRIHNRKISQAAREQKGKTSNSIWYAECA